MFFQQGTDWVSFQRIDRNSVTGLNEFCFSKDKGFNLVFQRIKNLIGVFQGYCYNLFNYCYCLL